MEPQNLTPQSRAYDAFPFVVRLKDSYVGLFSTGPKHGDSLGQIMMRVEVGASGELEYRCRPFSNKTDRYDTALIEDLLEEGDAVTLKTWCIYKANQQIRVSYIPFVEVEGQKYSLWSRAAVDPGTGVTYRTGYCRIGVSGRAAVFSSTNNGRDWSLLSVAFSHPELRFSEMDIAHVGDASWIAVCREDSVGDRGLYFSRSDDGMRTWKPVSKLADGVVGTQPNLLALSPGRIILCAGDRVGDTGILDDGSINQSGDTTGISLWQSWDQGAHWGDAVELSAMYSTDGGQPMACKLSDSALIVFFYRSTGKDFDADINAVRVWLDKI